MKRIAALTCFAIGAFPFVALAQNATLVETLLMDGKLANGEKVLLSHLNANPRDDQARFGLGVLQFLQAVEHLSQSLYRHGALTGKWTDQIPLLRVVRVTGRNPDPQPVTYADVRKIIQVWVDDLRKAEQTLAAVSDDPKLKLPLHMGMVRMDFDGDGKIGEAEYLWKLYELVNPTRRLDEDAARKFEVGLDSADVVWLRGYCHLLMAMGEMILAYDEQQFFDATAHVFFERPVMQHPWIQERINVMDVNAGVDAVDAIAIIHLIRFELKDPQRLGEALNHLQEVIRLSREDWKRILAETDDDNEWIPGPRQSAMSPFMRTTDDVVRGWLEFLNEADDLLSGKKLVPFWRSKTGLGVNLNSVFMQPRQFDLVLWVQGTAATPYLEKGDLTKPATWNRLSNLLQGNFFRYALWFN